MKYPWGFRVFAVIQMIPAAFFIFGLILLIPDFFTTKQQPISFGFVNAVMFFFSSCSILVIILWLFKMRTARIALFLNSAVWFLFYSAWILLVFNNEEDVFWFLFIPGVPVALFILSMLLYSRSKKVKEYFSVPENKPGRQALVILFSIFAFLVIAPPAGVTLVDRFGSSYAPADYRSLSSSGDMQKYSRHNMTDDDLKTWWTPYNRDGRSAWVKFDFHKEIEISAVEIHPGSHYPDYPKHGDLFKLNRRLEEAQLEFDDKSTQVIKLADEDKKQIIEITPKKTRSLRLRVRKTRGGKKWNDLCVSHLMPLVDKKVFKEIE